MSEKIQIIAGPGASVVEIREGKALELREPVKINISGTLSAPYDFLDSGKLAFHNPLASHVLIDADKGTLMLISDETNHYQAKIFGSLTLFEDLVAFEINTDRKRTNQELIRFLKRVKFYFPDPLQHTGFLEKIQKFSASVQTMIKDERDNGGNSINAIEKKVTSELGQLKFKLELPIYKGYPKVAFEVEVCLDPTDKAINFFLESVELFTLIKEKKEQYINEEVEKLKAKFACSYIRLS